MKITIECMHMFLVQLYAYMSVFPVWFNIRVMKMSQNNNLFVTNVKMSNFTLSVNEDRDDVYFNNVTYKTLL